MKKIAIITDTDSSLPPEMASQYGIEQVPITVHFGEETYTTGVDINDALLFEKVAKLNKLPTTSAPSTGMFSAAFQRAFDQGADAIVCICVSSKVSSTYNSALNARELFADREIAVIDSLNLSMGQGFVVLAAAEAAQQGCSLEEITARALDINNRAHTYAALPTLKYLAMSGRVGKFVAGVADTFNIKPILTIRDGKLDLLEKVRTQKAAIQRIINLTSTSVAGKTVERLAIIHVNNENGALALKDQLCAVIRCPSQVIIAEFTAGLSVHAGSGVVGIVTVTGASS